MTLKELKRNLDKFACRHDIGYCYGNFPQNQNPPYIAYQSVDSTQITADGVCIYSEENVQLQLMTTMRNLKLEKELECIFHCEDVPFTKSFELDAEQKISIVTYNFMAETEDCVCQ